MRMGTITKLLRLDGQNRVCNHYLAFDARSRPLKAVLTRKVWSGYNLHAEQIVQQHNNLE